MAINKEALAEMMNEGEHMRPSVTAVPMITLEGNKGVYMRRNIGEQGYDKPVEIGQTFEGIIVGVRMALSDFKPKSIKSTPEYNLPTDSVPLFERKGKDAKTEKIDEGLIMTLKAKYPDLREQRWVYLIVNGEVVKFKVKGSGLKHWFKFLRDLQKKNLHTFDVRVKFDPVFEKNEEIGKEYYAPSLSIDKELADAELEEISPVIMKLAKEFKAVTQYQKKDVAAEAVDAPSLDEIPVINLDEEEIAPEDIPF